MRDVLTALVPETAPRLHNALVDYAHKISKRSNLNVQVECKGQPTHLPVQIYRQVYYIFREALTNIEKHAQAKQVEIKLNWTHRGLSIEIRDDGIGFDIQQEDQNGHYGLEIMRERAQEVDGRFSLASEQNLGTQISLWFPIEA
jgi:signal transduction histidine kinase